jgi:hypothetical protein
MGLFNSATGLNQTVGAVQSAFGALGAANSLSSSLSAVASAGFTAEGMRLATSGLTSGAEVVGDVMSAVATFGGGDAPSNDWRCRLSLPAWPSFRTSPVLAPLKDAGGLIFPYTPTINITETATYTPVTTIHSNYGFNAYKQSDPGSITITAPMYCEDSTQALYWIAALHYLRSVTKMFSGNDPKSGNPPPVVKFNAYGNYVFKDVPVVITNITVALPNDTDYIGCNVVGSAAGQVAGMLDSLGGLAGSLGGDGISEVLGGIGQIAGLLGTFGVGGSVSGGVTHVPTKSQFTVTLKPAYSRTSVRKFSLDQFVTGGYMNNGTGYI